MTTDIHADMFTFKHTRIQTHSHAHTLASIARHHAVQCAVDPFPSLLSYLQCVLAISKSKGFKGTTVSSFLVDHIHKVAMVKARSPRQDLMLLYLCVALCQSAQPLKLQKLGAETVAAITATARSRVQDPDLQVGVSMFCARVPPECVRT